MCLEGHLSVHPVQPVRPCGRFRANSPFSPVPVTLHPQPAPSSAQDFGFMEKELFHLLSPTKGEPQVPGDGPSHTAGVCDSLPCLVSYARPPGGRKPLTLSFIWKFPLLPSCLWSTQSLL